MHDLHVRGFLVVLLCGLVVGCSGKQMVEVKGRVTSGGQPIKLGPQGVLEVVLIPEADREKGEYTPFVAEVNYQDGTFHVEGGAPPGMYRISVQQMDPYPMNDKLMGKFYMTKSPIVREITGQVVEIDLTKPEG